MFYWNQNVRMKKEFLSQVLPHPFLTLSCCVDADNPVEELQTIISRLPYVNYCIIRYVIKFLKKVSKFSAENKMAPDNLGIVFGPTLIRSKQETETGIPDPLRDPSDIITLLILNCKEVFQQANAPPPPVSSSVGTPRKRSCTSSSDSSNKLLRSQSTSAPKRRRKTRTRNLGQATPRVVLDETATEVAITKNPRLSHLID